jgi:branched-chain amino acid transport system permease protein
MSVTVILAFTAINALVLGGASLMVRHCGHLTFSIAAAWGTAAYCFAVTARTTGSLFLGGLAGILGGVAACLLQWALSLRLKKLALALATLPLQEMLMALMASLPLFGGRMGIVGYQRIPLDRLWPLAVVLIVVAVVVPWAIGRSRLGKRLEAVRADRLAAESVGLRPALLWLPAYLAAGVLIGLAGVFYAAHVGAVVYNSFEIHLSILLLLATIVGERTGALGPLAGALFLVLIPELLRDLPLPVANPDFARNILFAVAAITVLAMKRVFPQRRGGAERDRILNHGDTEARRRLK